MSKSVLNKNIVSRAAVTVAGLLLGAGVCLGSSPFLIEDIKTGYQAGSSPVELVTIGETSYFAADDGVKGLELWKSDGTQVGTMLVKDIRPGALGSAPSQLVVAGSTLFFVADNGTNGKELWKSNGTAAGTVMVKDIRPGTNSPSITSLTAVGSSVFFSAYDGVNGIELWKSNGTAAGTVMVKDIKPGSGSSSPKELTAVGAKVAFIATTSLGQEPWESDGTGNGTKVIKDINTVGSSFPLDLTTVGANLFFTAVDGKGRELWKWDGATTTTRIDIFSGYQSSNPVELTAVGSMLFFLADNGTGIGTELFKSDGTVGGTVLVKDVVPGSGSPAARNLTGVGNQLFFAATDGLGEELWRSDGTAGGTYLVLNINPGAASSSPSELAAVGGQVYFSADDGAAHGVELWTSDGTGAGTSMVDDIRAGGADASPGEPTPSASLLFFSAEDATTGRELWGLQLGGEASLQLTKTFQSAAVAIGTSGHTFTLEVTNSGTATAYDVLVTDSVDNRLTVTDVQPAADCGASLGQSVECEFGELAPAASKTITVTFSVASTVQPATGVLNQAYASFLEGPTVSASDTVDIESPSCQGMPDTMEITTETIEGAYLAEACTSISAGPSVDLMGSADAVFRAGETVVLNNGFSVMSGGHLVVEIVPMSP